MANMPSSPSSDEQYFLSIDWCTSLIKSGKYNSCIPYSRRYKASTTEDAFFGNTLNSRITIPACLVLCPKSTPLGRPQSGEPINKSSALSHCPLLQPSQSPTLTHQAPLQYEPQSAADHVLSTAPSSLFPIRSIQVLVALEHGVNAYPHLSHGGLIATLLDESMGMLLTLNGTLDKEKRVGLPDVVPCPSELADVNRTRMARADGTMRKSDRDSIDVKEPAKSHHDSTVPDYPQKNDVNQLNKGQKSAFSLSTPQKNLKGSPPSISAVTKELRIQYKRPVRTPAVVIISVTFTAKTEAEVSLEAEETGREHYLDSHGSNRDAYDEKGVVAGNNQNSAAQPAEAVSKIPASNPQRHSKHRDFAMRAIMRCRHQGPTLAIGDAVFTMPRPKSKYEPESTSILRSQL